MIAKAARILLALIAAAALAGAVAVFSDSTAFWSPPRALTYIGAPLLLGLVCGFIALRKPAAGVLTLVYLAACGIALILGDIVLSLSPPTAAAPATIGVSPASAVGFVCPLSFPPSIEVMRLGDRIALPLGGIAGSIVGKDRQGADRRADEHGFNNPPGLWARAPIDILALGDSFTFGADVPVGEGFVDRIRQRFPATINLGCGGNGPLTELGGLIEYGDLLRPRTVLWGYFEGNDLTKDIYTEGRSPVLRQYLATDYRQGLAGQQSAIDAALAALLTRQASATSTSTPAPAAPKSRPGLLSHLTLAELRTRIGLRHAIKPDALADFDRVLQRAVSTTARWNGQLVFVYLPAETRYTGRIALADARGYAARVKAVAARHAIPIIDVADRLDREADPRGLYAGHFTVAGYAKVGEIVLEGLAALGSLPQKATDQAGMPATKEQR